MNNIRSRTVAVLSLAAFALATTVVSAEATQAGR